MMLRDHFTLMVGVKDNIHLHFVPQNSKQVPIVFGLNAPMVGGGEDFVLMSFVGNISMEKISKLAKTMDDYDDDDDDDDDDNNRN